jgi:hypothetical protein
VGANTATVPASGQATVFCDSTNILNANTTQAGGTSFSLVNGNAGSPSLNFGSETNTGVYRPGAGRFGISILGNLVLDTDANGINVTGAVNSTTKLVTASGTAAAPSITFTGDTDTGIYRTGANGVGVAANGAQVARFETTGLTVTGNGSFSGNVGAVDGNFSGNLESTGTGNFKGGISGGTF